MTTLRRGNIIAAVIILTAAGAWAQNIVITEINYNSPAWFNPEDWIEFYNNTAQEVDISNWVFKDEVDSQSFVFPEGTVLEPSGFVIMCADTNLFRVFFPGVDRYIGNFPYGLSGGGELIRLYNDQGYIVDYLTYDDQLPWPLEPDGFGPTLELIHPDLDNTLPESWRASVYPYGSPGIPGWLGIEQDDPAKAMPAEMQLLPIYPNPFNPTTNISFELRVASYVRLGVFDLEGRPAGSPLQSIWYPVGFHQITFDGSDLASGVYYARLAAGGFEQVRMLVLQK